MRLDFRVVWPDGSVHWTQGAGRVLRDAGGRAISMIGTGQDITERRRVEEQRDQLLLEERRAGEFREAFIDVISHELRTPITTILGLDPDPGPSGARRRSRLARGPARRRSRRIRATSSTRRGPAGPEPRGTWTADLRRRAAPAAPADRTDRRPGSSPTAVPHIEPARARTCPSSPAKDGTSSRSCATSWATPRSTRPWDEGRSVALAGRRASSRSG